MSLAGISGKRTQKIGLIAARLGALRRPLKCEHMSSPARSSRCISNHNSRFDDFLIKVNDAGKRRRLPCSSSNDVA